MSLVKVKRFAQVTLPPDLRKRFNLAEGDYLEAEAVEEGILLKPVAVVERKKAWDRVFKVVKRVHAKQPPSKLPAKEQEEEIAREIKALRKKHASRRA